MRHMLSSLCCGSSTAEQGPLEVPNQRSPLSKEEEASIIYLVNTITLSNRNVSYPVADSDIASPEEHALAWLIEDDPFLAPPFNFSFTKWYRIVQRFSLATLYYHMNGANWTNTTGWLKNEDECEWFGLTCNFTNPGQNSEFTGAITEIILGDNNLQGRIPEDLMRLRQLQRIQMEENSITGPFPATIGMHLPDLEKISIWSNLLSGTLPPSLGRLTHLQCVRKELIGGFFCFVAHFGSLTLTPSFLCFLRAMYIGKNQLSGPIPSEMGNMTSLAKFNPDFNRFNGTLPTELGLLTDMDNFYAVDNMFSGQIPESLSNWQKIQNAFFSGNDFTGSMPRGLCEAPDLIKLEADCTEVQCDSCCTRCT